MNRQRVEQYARATKDGRKRDRRSHIILLKNIQFIIFFFYERHLKTLTEMHKHSIPKFV